MTGMPPSDAPTPAYSPPPGGAAAPGFGVPAPSAGLPEAGGVAAAAGAADTASAPADTPTPRRRVDVLGIIAVVVGLLGLLPSLVIFLIGVMPEMQMIFWLLIVTIPLLGFGGAIAVILGIIGIIVAVRRRTRFVWSIIGVVLGILMLVPIALLYFGPTV
jgi:hypothetical protein